DCDTIDVERYSDGDLLYWNKSQRDWIVVSAASALIASAPGSYRFAFITKHSRRPSGVLAIKSGVLPTSETPPDVERKTSLARPEVRDNGICGEYPAFKPKKVPNGSYDAYHDFGIVDIPLSDRSTLESWHIRYLNSRGVCDDTNGLRGGRRNNRSQFSYGSSIVAAGWPLSSPGAVVGVALGDHRILYRRTEIRPYRMIDGAACVDFVVGFPKGKAVIRIVDLEARTNWPGGQRSDEHEWAK